WQLAKGLVQALHLERLASKYSRTTVMAVFNLINGGFSIALVSFVALVKQEAFIFPSLGATSFILFYVPMAQTASSINTLCSVLFSALMCLMALYIFGLKGQASAFFTGVDMPRVGAASLSMGFISCQMVVFLVSHSPAGDTSLIL